MDVLETEKKIGIETFLTSNPGIKGKLRSKPEDFKVKEISEYPSEKKDGKFTIANIKETNWETNKLIRTFSNCLNISRKRISFAGTKDKRAKTTRLFCFYQVSPEKLSQIKLKDVEIEDVYRSDKPISIGDLKGNKFEIKIRNIEESVTLNQIKKIISEIREKSVFPNFYGIQRFGSVRPITHLVGKHIINGNFERAVMTYIANPCESEDEETYNLRKKLQETKDYSTALKEYPDYLNFEKTMLNYLVQKPDDFIGALKKLPDNLLTMFVYAYQSYIFNRILSERIKRDIPIKQAIEGDIVYPVRDNVIENRSIPVTKNNLEKVNEQISKGKAVVTSILLGSDSKFSKGEMGKIEKKIVEEENVGPREFIVPETPSASSYGTRRHICEAVKNLDFKLGKDDLNKNKKALTLNFELSKGCYATSLLREIMKSEDIKKY